MKLALMVLPVLLDLPVVKEGNTGANFRFRFRSVHPGGCQAANILYVVERRGHGLPEAVFPKYDMVFQTERLRVRRFRHFSPERVTLQGEGKVETLHFGDHVLRFRVSGCSRRATLVPHTTSFVKWHATVNGKPVDMGITSLHGGPRCYMAIPAEDGIVEVVYRHSAWEHACTALFWIGAVVLALLWWRDTRPPEAP